MFLNLQPFDSRFKNFPIHMWSQIHCGYIIFHSGERIKKYQDLPDGCVWKPYPERKSQVESKISRYLWTGPLFSFTLRQSILRASFHRFVFVYCDWPEWFLKWFCFFVLIQNVFLYIFSTGQRNREKTSEQSCCCNIVWL